MAVVTISRGSYSRGKEVAEKVAQRLGYQCIAREILIEASDRFNIAEIKLTRALHDAPGVLQRFTYGKEKYVAFIEAAFLEHMFKGNVIYHGLAGHFFLKGVTHALKLRIISDLEDRVRLEMDREKISREEALHVLKKDDDERRKWGMNLYGIDTNDPALYDMVLHINKLKADDVVDLVCDVVQRPQFQPTEESRQALFDLLTAARVKVRLIEDVPNIRVTSQEGILYIQTSTPEGEENRMREFIDETALQIEGVKEVRIQVMPTTMY